MKPLFRPPPTTLLPLPWSLARPAIGAVLMASAFGA